MFPVYEFAIGPGPRAANEKTECNHESYADKATTGDLVLDASGLVCVAASSPSQRLTVSLQFLSSTFCFHLLVTANLYGILQHNLRKPTLLQFKE